VAPAPHDHLRVLDGEEYGMLGSTKWVEDQIRAGAGEIAAYVNVDSAARASGFLSNLTPGLRGALQQVLETVEDPDTGKLLSGTHGDAALPGFSSDTSPFTELMGAPAAELGFGRWYGNYHTLYDNPAWLKRFGDPGFRRSAVLARILTLYAGSLATSDIFPFRFEEVSVFARKSLAEVSRKVPGTVGPIEQAIGLYEEAAHAWDAGLVKRRWVSSARMQKADALVFGAIGSFSVRAERGREAVAFGRSNLLFGPSELTGCGAEPLPLLSRALRSRDQKEIQKAVAALSTAFVRARDQLRAAEFILSGKARK